MKRHMKKKSKKKEKKKRFVWGGGGDWRKPDDMNFLGIYNTD